MHAAKAWRLPQQQRPSAATQCRNSHWKKARKGRICTSVTRHSGWASWNNRASLLSSSCTKNGDRKHTMLCHNTVCTAGGSGRGNARQLERQRLICCPRPARREGRDGTGANPSSCVEAHCCPHPEDLRNQIPKATGHSTCSRPAYATRLLRCCAAFGCNLPHNPPSPRYHGCSPHATGPQTTSFEYQPYPWAQPSLPALTATGLPQNACQPVAGALPSAGPP